MGDATGLPSDGRQRYPVVQKPIKPDLDLRDMLRQHIVTRALAYRSNALGDPLLAMRVRDGLATLAFTAQWAGLGGAPVVLTGAGLGALVALHVAALSDAVLPAGVAGVVLWDGLASWRALLEAKSYPWPADAFVPGVLKHYDLPELVSALRCPVRVLNPRDGAGDLLDATALARLNRDAGERVYAAAGERVGAEAIGRALDEVLDA